MPMFASLALKSNTIMNEKVSIIQTLSQYSKVYTTTLLIDDSHENIRFKLFY